MAKLEKAKLKSQKLRVETEAYKNQKKHEKWDQAKKRRHDNIKEIEGKLGDLEERAKEKVAQAEVNRQVALSKYSKDK